MTKGYKFNSRACTSIVNGKPFQITYIIIQNEILYFKSISYFSKMHKILVRSFYLFTVTKRFISRRASIFKPGTCGLVS